MAQVIDTGQPIMVDLLTNRSLKGRQRILSGDLADMPLDRPRSIARSRYVENRVTANTTKW